jgi:Protein of unknown function (DUF3638)
VLWTLVQKCDRCLALLRSRSWAALQLELANPRRFNWRPCDEPGWLLLELEGDFLIRPQQVAVARAMQHPEGGSSASLQMNMGEGKSSVIVPMLAVALSKRSSSSSPSSSPSSNIVSHSSKSSSDSSSHSSSSSSSKSSSRDSSSSSSSSSNSSTSDSSTVLVRLVVPGPLFASNFASLTHQLGGLLQRCCYSLPCRRDMPLTAAHAAAALTVLQQSAHTGCPLLTLPEHRPSLQLKACDLSRCGSTADAAALFGLLQWLRVHARDVLDEVDELLRVSYQLVYTVGAAQPLDGADWRWRTLFAALQSVARHAAAVAAAHGPEAVEYCPAAGSSNSGSNSSSCSSNSSNSSSNNNSSGSSSSSSSAFPLLRLLCPHAAADLLQRVAQDLLSGADSDLPLPQLLESEQQQLQQLLLREEVDSTVLAAVQLVPEGPARDVILTLRGLLAHGVLLQVLSRRWRVEYGVSAQHRRLMAVPFR